MSQVAEVPKQPLVYKTVALTPTQIEQWSQTKAAIQWHAPAFTHLLYKMMNPDESNNVLYFTKDPAMPTLATDEQRIFADVDFFFGLTIPERVAAVCHEVSHAMFAHCSVSWRLAQQGKVVHNNKVLDYDPDFANAAQDFIINDMLHEAKIGKLGKGWLHDPKIGGANDPWQQAYFKIYKKQKGGGGKQPGQFDTHMAPGAGQQGAQPAANQHNAQQWKQAIAGAKAVAQAAGKLPDTLGKMFDEMLEPEVKWTDHIQGLFARKVGSGSYDFRKPDRRFISREIWAPGRSGFGCGTVVVGVDTSGSIYAVPKLLDRFMSEISGMLEDLRPRRIVLIWCDAQVQRVDEAEDAHDLNLIRAKGSIGGGGTSFVPVFAEIEKLGIENMDAVVYLTDGDGTFPRKPPAYTCIWGDISGDPKKYPWGDVVAIPTDGTA